MADSVPLGGASMDSGARAVPGGALTLADDLSLSRMGYGAMQLAGPGVFGPPRDRDEAIAVLRTAVDLGVTHIDTSDFYGPATVNEVIRDALHPYPGDLRIVTKVGARRDADAAWIPSHSPDEPDQPGPRQPAEPGRGRPRRRQPPDLHGGGRRTSPWPSSSPCSPGCARPGSSATSGSAGHRRPAHRGPAHRPGRHRAEPLQRGQPRGRRAGRPLRAGGHRLRAVLPARRILPAAADVLDKVAATLGASPQQVALAWLLHRSPAIGPSRARPPSRTCATTSRRPASRCPPTRSPRSTRSAASPAGHRRSATRP